MTWTDIPFDQVGIAVLGVTAVFLSQDSRFAVRRWSCIFGLLGQPFWFIAAVKASQWGIFLLCCLYTVSWARGVWINWIVPYREKRNASNS